MPQALAKGWRVQPQQRLHHPPIADTSTDHHPSTAPPTQYSHPGMTATESAIHPMFNVWSTQCLNHLSKRLRTVNKAFVDISNCWPGVLHLYNLTCVCQCENQNNLVGQKSLTRFYLGLSLRQLSLCPLSSLPQRHTNVYNTNTNRQQCVQHKHTHTLIGPFPACSWFKGTDGFVWNVEEKWINLWMTDGPEQTMYNMYNLAKSKQRNLSQV